MQEIKKEMLQEYFYPTANFQRKTDGTVVDYAEIEIMPQDIQKLERNLERCGNPEKWTEKEWNELTTPDDDAYEHIVAYVHFDAGSDTFNKLFIEVVTAHAADPLDVEKLVNEDEKQIIIEAALESLHKWRGTPKMMQA